MRSINGTSAHYVKPLGRGTRISTAVGSWILALTGPVLVLIASLQPGGLLRVFGGIVLTALGIPFSVWLWRSVRRQESRIGRLQASGVVAVAEILAVTPATVGKTRDVALDLRLTASGIEAYDATILCAEDERLVVGETMAAVIEPSSKDFTVESDLVRGERVSL